VGVERAFRVFVAGASWRSQRVVRALHDLCAAHGISQYRVEVVDVLQDPASAERDRVLALPMVMRVVPEPVVRVVGDLSDGRLAAEVLGLTEPDPAPRTGAGHDRRDAPVPLERLATGIAGFDRISGGGLPSAATRWWSAGRARARRCSRCSSWPRASGSSASTGCS
jgi:circadian clock protein KaiB